jgi:tetratricopeptide (TPR) repeat protein
LEHIQRAWRLSPFPEDWYFDALGAAHYGAGRYDEAIAAWNECRRRMPDYLWCRVTMTFAYMKAGEEGKAHEVAKEVLRINPRFSSRDWSRIIGDSNAALLRQAGLPE